MITSGSIRKRDTADGKTWQITIELPKDPITGKRVRKYKSVEGTKKDAERAMHEYIRELEKGYYVKDTKITISEWIDTWLEVYIIPNVSPTTLSRYQGMIKRYIKSNFKVIVFVHHCRLPHKIKNPLWRGQHP